MHRKKIIILGCTGSIGQSAAAVYRGCPGELEITGLSAHNNEKQLLQTAREFGTGNLCLSGKHPESEYIAYHGTEGLLRFVEETEADIVLNGIAGSGGLLPSVAAIRSGKRLALANKETIVMAGRLISGMARTSGAEIIPVDSEHSAVFHLLKMVPADHLAEIILTASGGAFRDLPASELEGVSIEHALAHPTWDMGVKITIDSASLANKGLEVIEAHHLFNIPPGRIKVIIHPQSYIHSLIRTIDGTLYAQISAPDMQLPIRNAITYPDLWESGLGKFDLAGKRLDFSPPDFDKYRMLALAFEVLGRNGAYSVVYNASNEQAVSAFTENRIRFVDIPAVVEKMLERDWGDEPGSIDDVLRIHKEAADRTDELIQMRKSIR